MSKQEADKLAGALVEIVHFSGKSRDWCNAAAALLRRWPDAGEPVAWLSDDGNRVAFHQHQDCTRPLYTALPDSAARIAELEAERDALRRLIADDAHAMTFQTLGQYRSALLAAIRALAKEITP